MTKKSKTPPIPRVPKVPAIPKPGVRPRPRPPQMNRAMAPFGDDSLDMMSPDGQLGFAPSAEDRIAEWLDSRVLPKNVAGLILRLAQKVTGGDNTVQEWTAEELAGEAEGEADAQSISSLIYGTAAEEMASGAHSGHTAFVVQALRPDGSQVSRCFFRMAPEDMAQGFETEDGATSQGHMAQAHRHSEVFARMMVGQSESVMRHLREQNREFFAQASKSITLQVQVADMFQKIQDRQMMRDIIMKRVSRKEEMKTQVISYALSFLPDVLNRFGIVPGAQKESLQTAVALEAVLSELDEGQVKMIAMGLPKKEQRDAFTAVYIGAKKKAAAVAAKAAADAAKKAAGDAQKNGTTDVAIGLATTTAAALNGKPPVVTPPPAQPEAKPAGAVDLSDDDKKVVFKTITHFIDLLCGLDDATYQLALTKLPPGVHGVITDVRNALREYKRASKKNKHVPAPKLTGDQLLAIQGTIVQLAATLDDMSWGMLVSKIDKKAQPDVQKARDIIRARLGAT